MATHHYALIAVGILVLYIVVTKIIAYVEAVRFAKANGCEPLRKFPQSERILGWEIYQQSKKLRASHEFLETGRQRYLTYGHTYEITVMGRTFITTDEPENVKCILATNFKDYGIGQRLEAFGPQFGSGIFTTDGAHWEHSRVGYSVNKIILGLADMHRLS
jgi:hypothetical protein